MCQFTPRKRRVFEFAPVDRRPSYVTTECPFKYAYMFTSIERRAFMSVYLCVYTVGKVL